MILEALIGDYDIVGGIFTDAEIHSIDAWVKFVFWTKLGANINILMMNLPLLELPLSHLAKYVLKLGSMAVGVLMNLELLVQLGRLTWDYLP